MPLCILVYGCELGVVVKTTADSVLCSLENMALYKKLDFPSDQGFPRGSRAESFLAISREG